MLISVVMDPACVAPTSIATAEAAAHVERILEAVLNNAVFVGDSVDCVVDKLLSAVVHLDPRFGQQIQLQVAEIAKNRDRCIVAPLIPSSTDTETPVSHFRRLAIDMRADIVITSSPAHIPQFADLVAKGLEVCVPAGYRKSKAESYRRAWSATTRIDRLPTVVHKGVLGRAIRYGTEIVVVDKMFARAAKDGRPSGRLDRFSQGIAHLVDCWLQESPHASHTAPTIKIISVAGQTGAGGGYIDPKLAEPAIRRSIASADVQRRICDLSVLLKDDRDPSIVEDRFVASFHRCWGIRHGCDDIGKLAGPASKRRPTFLDPDCQAHRDLLSEILALPSAR